MISHQGEVPLPDFPRDELARYFSLDRRQK
jgi:hypothetical protein